MYQTTVKHDPYLNIYVDSYILTTDASCVLIDSGLYGQRELIEEKLRGREGTLLCTHGHWDHIGMHKTVQELGGRVLAHPGDKPYYEDHDWHWRTLFGQFQNDFDLPAARRETYVARVGSPMVPEYALQDGQQVAAGDLRFEVIGVPGHSKGSVCFLELETGALFTGDGLIGDGFFGGMPQYVDVPAYRQSMEKLARVTCDTVYSDHNPPMEGRLLRAKAMEGLACCERIDRAVRAFVAAHAADEDLSLGELIRAIGRAEGKNAGAGTCTTALAHLEAMPDAPACVGRCLARYIHGI